MPSSRSFARRWFCRYSYAWRRYRLLSAGWVRSMAKSRRLGPRPGWGWSRWSATRSLRCYRRSRKVSVKGPGGATKFPGSGPSPVGVPSAPEDPTPGCSHPWRRCQAKPVSQTPRQSARRPRPAERSQLDTATRTMLLPAQLFPQLPPACRGTAPTWRSDPPPPQSSHGYRRIQNKAAQYG